MGRQFSRRHHFPIVRLRRSVQWTFLLLNLSIGVQFYLWVRFYETGGASAYVSRPAGVEGWLPIAGLMNLKYVALTRHLPEVHPAGMFLLLAFLTISLLFRKAFCSWLCPIGTISEWLWEGGREMFGRSFAPPRWLDIALRSLKYMLLSLFVAAVASMSAAEIRAFLESPYGMVADVKMLDFFRRASTATIGVCSALVVLSIVTKNFWCRYLCPYGALMGLVSILSPSRIVRDPSACIDCGKCAKACPSLIPVDTLRSVQTPECTACLACVAACPVESALDLRTVVGRRRIPAPVLAAGVAAIFLIIVAAAKATGSWTGHIPERTFMTLIPNVGRYSHPR